MARLQDRPREEVIQWMKSFHATNDSLSTTNFSKFYTRDAVVVTTSGAEIHGLDEIEKFFTTQFTHLALMHHSFKEEDMDIVGNKIYVPCVITYVVKDDLTGEEFDVPACGMFGLGEGEGEGVLERLQIWLDGGRVWRRMEEINGRGAGGGGLGGCGRDMGEEKGF